MRASDWPAGQIQSLRLGVVGEVGIGVEAARAWIASAFVVQRIGLIGVPLLMGKALVTLAHGAVCDQRLHAQLGQWLVVGLTLIVAAATRGLCEFA